MELWPDLQQYAWCVERELDPEKHGREINRAGTDMTLFQCTNTNQGQVLYVRS